GRARVGRVAGSTAALEQMPELTGRGSVWSLASGRAKRFAMQDGDLDVRQLMPAVPTEPQALARLRQDVFADHRFVGTLVSADGRAAGRVAGLSTPGPGPGR